MPLHNRSERIRLPGVALLPIHAQNAPVLDYLARHSPGHPAVVFADATGEVAFPPGCHPDIVERLWSHIAASLPTDCRCLVHGTPTLARRETGVIFGIGIGTAYGLWLPPDVRAQAEAAGARTSTTWGSGATMDIASTLGDGWMFGAWHAAELAWSRSACATLPPAR